MKISEALAGVDRILIDTAPVIYHLEGHPQFAPVLRAFFDLRAKSGIELITTPITLAECSVHPLRRQAEDLADAFRRLLVQGDNTVFWPIGESEAVMAARLRAQVGFALADALQVAIAVESGCSAILTNDAAFNRVTGIRVLVVNQLEP